MADIHEDAAQEIIVQIGALSTTELFGPVNRAAQSWADEHSGELISGLEDYTREEIRDIIANGLREGISREDLADQLRSAYAFSEERAQLIATTEAQLANGAGSVAGLRQARDAGVEVLKEWVPDPDCCEECQENADEGPIPADDEFPSGDDSEPAHPNCRCYTRGVIIEPDKGGEDENADESGGSE